MKIKQAVVMVLSFSFALVFTCSICFHTSAEQNNINFEDYVEKAENPHMLWGFHLESPFRKHMIW